MVAERLQQVIGNRATTALLARGSSAVQRDDAEDAPEEQSGTVTITVKWDHTTPPKTYLEKVFDEHPVDWTADVYVNGKKEGQGDGSLEVEIAKGSRPQVKVVPTAEAPDDYYKASRARPKQGTTATDADLEIRLRYNRQNRRFTDRSWENRDIDPDKAAKVKSYTLLGRNVRLNEAAADTVEATNKLFDELSEAKRQEISDSIVSMGGYNRRTTSTGAFSNHSIGTAVDINAHRPTKQNHHWKKRRKTDEELMKLFQHVVVLDSGWKDYDPWKEEDASKILEASERFNRHFPRFLAGLLDDALGKGWDPARENAAADWSKTISDVMGFLVSESQARTFVEQVQQLMLGPELLQKVDPALLKRAVKAAKKAGKTDTAAWLQRIARGWTAVRAWVEGIVVYKKRGEWAYQSEHEKKPPSTAPEVKGTLKGMVSLNETMVDVLQKGGWTWLVDHTKDYMHFEDRAARAAIKKDEPGGT